MSSVTSLGLVVRMTLSWYFSPARGIRNLAIWASVSLSPPWEIRAYPSRTSPRYIMYSHQRSESVSSMSYKEKLVSQDSLAYGGYAHRTSASHNRAVLPKQHHDCLFLSSSKSKDNAGVALVSSNTLLENSGFNQFTHLVQDNTTFIPLGDATSELLFVNIQSHFQWEKLPDFNAFLVNKDSAVSRLLNPDWSIQISGAPAVWELVIYRTKPSSRKIHTLHLNYFSPRHILRWKALDKIEIRNQKSSFSFDSSHACGKQFSIQHFSGLFSWNAVTLGKSPYARYSRKKIITKFVFNSFNSGLRPAEKVDWTHQAKTSFSR